MVPDVMMGLEGSLVVITILSARAEEEVPAIFGLPVELHVGDEVRMDAPVLELLKLLGTLIVSVPKDQMFVLH